MEVHQRTANLEVFREVVLPVHAHHRLSLHTVLRVRLQRHTHVGPGVDDALVEDGHLTGRIVYSIVRALGQFHTTRRHLHRPLWHIVGSQRNHIGRRSLILAHKQVFVFLGDESRHRLGRVV